MDLQELKNQHLRNRLRIGDEFARIRSFIDFGNVNYWFKDDRRSAEGGALGDDERLIIEALLGI